MDQQQQNKLALTADIVAAHVSHNNVAVSELALLINSVHTALNGLGDEPPGKPAVSIDHSVKHEYLVCLEDGNRMKMLKRYLITHYRMSPNDYRTKWGLPSDYPMVAPAYAEVRRKLAKKIGLGKGPKTK